MHERRTGFSLTRSEAGEAGAATTIMAVHNVRQYDIHVTEKVRDDGCSQGKCQQLEEFVFCVQ